MQRFDAILIDFYGTISAGDRLAVENACARIVEHFGLAATPAEFAVEWGVRFFATIENSNHDDFRTLHECELMSLRETLQPVVGDFDPRPFVADLEAYWANPPLQADVHDFFAGVSVPVCCVSNADSAPLQQAIQRHGLHFDAVVASEHVRCYKPDAEIFRQAIQRLGVNAGRVMHIGDSLHSDINGAGKLGITTTWICRDDRIHDIGQCDPHHTVCSLRDIHRLLNE